MSITINDATFAPVEGVVYRSDYEKVHRDIASAYREKGTAYGESFERTMFKNLFESDLFFIVFFLLKNPIVNCEFGVEACKEVESGPDDMTLDIWAREHLKSTIITLAESIQWVAMNPEDCCCLMSATRPLSKALLDSVKKFMEEEAAFLNFIYPHKPSEGLWGPFWMAPKTESPNWSLDNGLSLRRKTTRKEPSFYAAGLEEGLPTGFHFKRRVYDDITNEDMANSIPRMANVRRKFDSSDNVGTIDGHHRVVGTYYHHGDPLTHIRDLKSIEDPTVPAYTVRIKPATHDGSANGVPVFLTQKRLDQLKLRSTFNCQQLCDPVPEGSRKLHGSLVTDINPEMIPGDVIKVMGIDPAGDEKEGKGDSWAMMVCAISPIPDAIGAFSFYFTDAFIDTLSEAEAPDIAANMFINAGLIQMLAIEKLGQSTAEIHIGGALAKRGRHVSIKAKNLMLLSHKGRSKTRRINDSLSRPLFNGNIYLSTSIPKPYRDRIREELDTYPLGVRDDGIDVMAYIINDVFNEPIVRAALRNMEAIVRKGPAEKPARFRQRTGGHGWLGN